MKDKKRASILVVDDDADVLEATSLLLEELGYRTVPASNAEEAIERFRTDSIDVVLTDIVMPSISGIDLLRCLHDIETQVPVILMTAYADMDKVMDAIKIGAFDFIIKPFTASLLEHSVNKAVNHVKYLRMEKNYRKLLEEYNREIETLVSERTMSLMALAVADRIRNPASIIGLTCRRILDREKVPEKMKQDLDGIMYEAGKLDKIVTDFQSLLESRKSVFSYEDFNGTVESVVSITAKMAAEKGVQLNFISAEHPIKINMEKNLFRIAVAHIIRNSIEATPEGGKVTVSIVQDDNAAVVEVADTGQGIRQDDIKRIFTPMYSTREKRFGMGLPLVKKIVQAHMGEVEVKSNPGNGTVFRVKVPLRWTETKI